MTSETIALAVAEAVGLKRDDLERRSRRVVYSHPRQIAMYLSRRLTTESDREIGWTFERSHPSVGNAVKKIAAEMAADEDFRARVEAIAQSLTEANR